MPRRRARLLALAAAALLLAALLAALPRVITGEARADTRRPGYPPDWLHVLQVINVLDANPPKVPAVYLLGGSSARESTVSDHSWAAEVHRFGGPRVCTYNFGTNGQTYAQDITIVNGLPAVPSIVLIGANLGRYVGQPDRGPGQGGEHPTASADRQPRGRPSTRGYTQHQYSVGHILTDREKRTLVRRWLKLRYPLFQQNFLGNTARLEQLITICQKLGLHPVLLELPLNRKIVGRAFAKPRVRYRDSCRKLAKKYGIPNISFLSKVGLVSGDFFDMSHLVEPGRVKWQRRLSQMVVALLKRYDMDSR